MNGDEMQKIQEDLSGPTVINAIEANLFAMFSQFCHWPRVEVHDDSTMLWSITDIQFPLFNSVLRTNLGSDEVDAAIQAVICRYRSKKVPMLWWTGPATQPADLEIRLAAQGFQSEFSPGMAMGLQSLPETATVVPGFTIEPVKDLASADLWCRIFSRGFDLPDFAQKAFLDLLASLGFAPESPFVCYIGRLNGEAVATSSQFFGAGVAGVYNVTTLPEGRNQGIGTAMTLLPLLEARALGYRIGILHSSAMGTNVYRKLGFQEYCRIGQHIWAGD